MTCYLLGINTLTRQRKTYPEKMLFSRAKWRFLSQRASECITTINVVRASDDSPIKNVWWAVIELSIRDFASSNLANIRDASAFFNSPGFEKVCAAIDLDYEWTKGVIMRFCSDVNLLRNTQLNEAREKTQIINEMGHEEYYALFMTSLAGIRLHERA